MALRIYNTLSREKQDFVPLEPGKVRMYVCGITSYAPSHIGHARAYVSFDVVYRWLRRSYAVTYVRNFTDVDDKIIKAAREVGESPKTLADRYIAQFHHDMEMLHCAKPSIEPKVTEHVPDIVDLIAKLEKQSYGYAVDGDVYFDVLKYPAYGRLSGRSLSELEAGARVEVDPRKHSPYDFAMWKSAKPGEPAWDSPWGKGRPGWHIECSAMSTKYLGLPFDIHGGGKDLVFPHHENELAQACAATGQNELARVWMHNGFVNLLPEHCPRCDAEMEVTGDVSLEEAQSTVMERCQQCGYRLTDDDLKMSKSRGNFYPIREIAARYEAEALRYVLLNSHYRSPIQFAHTLLDQTESRLDRNYETLKRMKEFTGEQTSVPGKSFEALFGFDPRKRFKDAMDDDFNTAKALGDLSELFTLANALIDGTEKSKIGEVLSPQDTSRVLAEIQEMVRDSGEVLGLWLEDARQYLERRKMARASKLPITPAQIEAKIGDRNRARKEKNFKLADQIRDELKALGIVLKDSQKGTEWYAAEE
jgi:cysteinyl-tRNA synthetase